MPQVQPPRLGYRAVCSTMHAPCHSTAGRHGCSRVQEAAKKQRAKMEAAAAARAARKTALREKVDAAREWSEEEVRMLDKGLEKFPVGVPRRWEQVTGYVRTRTQEEILFMVKVRLPSRRPLPLWPVCGCVLDGHIRSSAHERHVGARYCALAKPDLGPAANVAPPKAPGLFVADGDPMLLIVVELLLVVEFKQQVARERVASSRHACADPAGSAREQVPAGLAGGPQGGGRRKGRDLCTA